MLISGGADGVVQVADCGWRTGGDAQISATRKLPNYAIRYYTNQIASNPEALSAQFNWYRAIDTTVTQNEQRATQGLTMPVLAIAGEKRALA
jgi:hypothetical protein